MQASPSATPEGTGTNEPRRVAATGASRRDRGQGREILSGLMPRSALVWFPRPWSSVLIVAVSPDNVTSPLQRSPSG